MILSSSILLNSLFTQTHGLIFTVLIVSVSILFGDGGIFDFEGSHF